MQRLVVLIFLALSLSGCVYGAVYSSTRQPLVTNMRETPKGVLRGQAGTCLLSIPVSAAQLSVGWDSRAIGDAARKAGMTEIYYADLHTRSVLLGLWEQETVEVYGR